MDSSDSSPSPPLAEESTIDTINPIFPEETAPAELFGSQLFDCQDSPEVKHHFTSPLPRVRKPTRPSPKPAHRNFLFSASTTDRDSRSTTVPSSSTSSGQSTSSRAGSEVIEVDEAEESEDLFVPTSSGEVDDKYKIPKGLKRSELKSRLAKQLKLNRKLEKELIRIHNFAETETRLKAGLELKLESLEPFQSNLEQQNEKLGKQIRELEESHKKVLSENTDLKEANKSLRQTNSTLKKRYIDFEALNATQANQMQVLKEDVLRKTKSIRADQKELLAFKKDLEKVEKQLQAEKDKNLALNDKREAMEHELAAVEVRVQEFEKQQIALEDELFRYNGGVVLPHKSSPAYLSSGSDTDTKGWAPLIVASRKPQEERLSDIPALADEESILPKPSLRGSPIDNAQRYNEIVAPLTTIDDSGVPLSISTNNAATQTDVPPVATARITTTTESGTQTTDSVVTARNTTTESDARTFVPPLVVARTTSTSESYTQTTNPVVAAPPLSGPVAVAVKVGRPLWHHLALGSLLFFFLIVHAIYAERRLWMDANELSRSAVVSMRDEWWGSPWIDKMDYAIGQALAVDRTGFC